MQPTNRPNNYPIIVTLQIFFVDQLDFLKSGDRQYTSYQDALLKLNLPTLEERRNELYLKFAKKCLDNEKFKDLFPENPPHQITTRNYEKYEIPHCLTERMKHSGLMHMKYQLNTDHNTNRKDQ